MTKEQFNDILNAFNKNDLVQMHMGVRLVASNDLHMDYLSEIPEYMKTSLCRKVLRYVAQTALRGTMEVDGLAYSARFCAMENGHSVSFGDIRKWSFWSHRLNKKIIVSISNNEFARFYDTEHNLLMKVKIWQGCHWTQSIGRIDLVGYFDDVRNPLMV